MFKDKQARKVIDNIAKVLGYEVRWYGCLDSYIEKIDYEDSKCWKNREALEEKFNLLLEYLKLEIQEGKRIVKKKYG